MISVPGAVSKAIFDMIRDYFRTRRKGNTNVETQVLPPRQSINLEEGIQLHRADSYADPAMPPDTPAPPPHIKETDATGSNTANAGIGTRTNSDTTLVMDHPSQQIISLQPYLKEKITGTKLESWLNTFVRRFPTFSATLRRLPYALLPFAFSQFILVEALAYTGWITVFSTWMAIVIGLSIPATIFFVTLMSILLCNCSGTNIGATILLVKILKHPNYIGRAGFNSKLNAAGMLAVAIGSNIGAVSFVFSASLAGLLWRGILRQKGIHVGGGEFVRWNLLPLGCMMVAGCAVALAVVTVAPI